MARARRFASHLIGMYAAFSSALCQICDRLQQTKQKECALLQATSARNSCFVSRKIDTLRTLRLPPSSSRSASFSSARRVLFLTVVLNNSLNVFNSTKRGSFSHFACLRQCLLKTNSFCDKLLIQILLNVRSM